MPKSYNRIWIHAIWATKNRERLISSGIEDQVHSFIKEQLKELACPVRIVNGMPDHVHCLFLLNAQKSLTGIIKQVKGSSSFFINNQKLTEEPFAWQRGYAAFSVGDKDSDRVYEYIKHQKRHHIKLTLEEEYDVFL